MELVQQIDAHPAACATLDLDPRGRFRLRQYEKVIKIQTRYLILGSNDSIASLWNTDEWFCVRTFSQQESVSFELITSQF